MFRNFKLIIEYDGTRYNGWQRLGNTDNTIQYKIENVLSRMVDQKIKIVGSGRTDAGVHAYHQVANFKGQTGMTPEEIRDYCNQYLPEDIVIKSVEEAEERFHSRYNASSKKYLYRIWNSKVPTAFFRKYSYQIEEPLDLEAMKQGASYLMGEHDFQAYTTMKSKKKSTVREIYAIDFMRLDARFDIMLHGNGFLHNMVRIIVGTLIQVGLGQRKPEEVKEILDTKIRENAGPTAPGQALFLYEVYYDELDKDNQ